MAIEKTHLYKVDLARALTKTAINAVFSTDNKQADVFVLDVVRNGHREDLSNVVVTGTFVCHSNDITVPVTMGGRVEENKAILTLSDGCYLASGLCTISIHLSIGEKLSTIFIGTLLMNQTATDTVLDPDNVIPSISELLAQIEAIRQATRESEQATEAAHDATQNANEATQSANEAAENANKIAEDVQEQLDSGRLKGEKGDTGSTPNILFQVATGEPGTQVQIAQSGTVENPIISLTIPRGNPGNGNVSTVCGKQPDNDGNVGLTAEDVGAASKENLLRNSNFQKPVNQRKETSYTGSGYTIDCWKLTNSTTQITVHDGFINIKALNGGPGYLRQQFFNRITSGVYTLAVCVRGSGQGRVYFTYDKISAQAGSITFIPGNDWKIYCVTSDVATAQYAPDQFSIRSDDEVGFDILWAAMYEGAFTAETLPPFQSKRFAPVLTECKLDYQNSWYGTGRDVEQIYTGVIFDSSTMDVRIPVSHMRALPTVNFLPKEDGTPSWRVYHQGSYRDIRSINISRPSTDALMVRIKKGSTDESTWTPDSAAIAVGNWEASCEP